MDGEICTQIAPRIPPALDYSTKYPGHLDLRPDTAKEAILPAVAESHILVIPCLWSELRQAARAAGVVHLDDVLLCRARQGLLSPNGCIDLLLRIRGVVRVRVL